MKPPTFSIVIPTYNRAHMLERTVAAVQAQTVTDWELLIIDDGSTDHTHAVVERLQANDARIQYIYQSNARQAAARNTGLRTARGEWVTYVDSDDEIYPTYLEHAATFFASHRSVVFATAFMDRVLELRDGHGRLLRSTVQPPTQKDIYHITIEDYANWDIKPCGTGIFHKRAEVMQARIAWDPAFKLLEDLDFLLQCGRRFENGFGYIPEKLFRYIQVWGTDGVCANASYGDYADAFQRIYLKHGASPLLQHQQWYPNKIQKYRALQAQFDAGEIGSAASEIVFPGTML